MPFDVMNLYQLPSILTLAHTSNYSASVAAGNRKKSPAPFLVSCTAPSNPWARDLQPFLAVGRASANWLGMPTSPFFVSWKQRQFCPFCLHKHKLPSLHLNQKMPQPPSIPVQYCQPQFFSWVVDLQKDIWGAMPLLQNKKAERKLWWVWFCSGPSNYN